MKPFGSDIKTNTLIVGKPKKKKKDITPGPGTFYPDDKLIKSKVQGFRINRSTKSTRYNCRSAWVDYSPTKNNPDPGQYETEQSIAYVKPSTVGFRIKEPARILWTGDF